MSFLKMDMFIFGMWIVGLGVCLICFLLDFFFLEKWDDFFIVFKIS